MSRDLGAWRPALRMAARDVRRHKGRSLLVVMLVGLPVLLSAMAATLISTQQESVVERLPVELGQAQASASFYGEPMRQNADATNLEYSGTGERLDVDAAAARLAELTGGTVLPVARESARVVIGNRGWSVDVLRTDFTSTLTRGMSVLEAGRVARADDEVVVTRAMADDGAQIGRPVLVDGHELTVVGIGTVDTVGSDARSRAVAIPQDSVVPPSPIGEKSLLIDRTEPVTWADVQQLNAQGFVVVSRSVVTDQPPDSQQVSDAGDNADKELAAIVVTALVIEVVLLAGPAFAVSVRRQRHELATVAAAGGSPGDLRRIVLAQAIVLGAGACVVAAALSVPASWAAARVLGGVLDAGVGPFDVAWVAIAATVVLGVLASVFAAWIPARQAARSDVVAALAGRVPAPRASAGWPLAGALLMGIGFGGIVTQRSEAGIATLTIVTVIGAVLLTPLIIGLVARLATRLPLAVRLAVRDSDRQRARSAPAIAAIMASVSAVTALAIASSSDEAEQAKGFIYSAPLGSVTLTATTETMPAAVAAAERVSAARFTPLPRVGDVEGSRQVSAMVPDSEGGLSSSSAMVAVADTQILRGWGVRITSAQQAVLDAGGALVPDSSMIESGQVTFHDFTSGMEQEATISVPAAAADLSTGDVPRGPAPLVAGAVISPATAQRLGLPVIVDVARADRSAADMDVSEVRQAVIAAAPTAGEVGVERIYKSTYITIFAILAVLGALAITLGTFSATGLALSDARRDLATLVAVGASPRTRRLFAGAQALVLSVIGTVMGVVIGFAPGLAAARTLTGYSGTGTVIDIPWSLLAILVIGVPLAVAAITTVVSRGRPPLDERGTA